MRLGDASVLSPPLLALSRSQSLAMELVDPIADPATEPWDIEELSDGGHDSSCDLMHGGGAPRPSRHSWPQCG